MDDDKQGAWQELRTIWHSHTLWENLCWLVSIAHLMIILPYYIIKELLKNE